MNKYPAPEIVHSDQGSEYRSQRYRDLLRSFDIKPSMSEKASPWQNGYNGYKESFYSEFKLGLGHPEGYPTLGELIEAIAKQIHYYNNERIQTVLKCPPKVFALKYQLNQQLTMIKTSTTKVDIINPLKSIQAAIQSETMCLKNGYLTDRLHRTSQIAVRLRVHPKIRQKDSVV